MWEKQCARNDSRYPKSERNVIDSGSSRVHEKSPVKFGPQTKKFYWLTLSHPSEFLEDYISAPRGCCALIFIHALEIAQALIAQNEVGRGAPKKISIVKI